MNIKIFLLSSFALSQVLLSLVLFMLPSKTLTSIYAPTQKQKFFSDISLAMGKTKPKTIDNFDLKAIFNENNNGFILFYDGTKQVVLGLGGEYGGYTLESVGQNFAVLNKNGTLYELSLAKSAGETQTISKTSAQKLLSNPNELIDAIDITETTNGVKIIKLKPSSIFGKMGLEKNDVIQEINDKPITSVADLTSVMPSVQNADTIKIKISRNNQEKELTYEVK